MYQLNNYVLYNNDRVQVSSIANGVLGLTNADGDTFVSSWSKVTPIFLSKQVFDELGFEPTTRDRKLLHVKYMYTFTINGRMHHVHGHEFDDKGVWIVQGLNIRCVHELQNVFSIIEPSFTFKFKSNDTTN